MNILLDKERNQRIRGSQPVEETDELYLCSSKSHSQTISTVLILKNLLRKGKQTKYLSFLAL